MKKIVVNFFICLYFIITILITYCLLSYNKYNIPEFDNHLMLILDEKMENVDDFEDDDVAIKEEMIEGERCIEKEDDLMEDGALGNDVINEVKKTYEEIMPDGEDININNDNTNINLFDDFSSSDTYATYHVYVVKEEDTLDTILNKYEISKEDLENYNNISDIKKGDKLIIPKNVQ